ncbi:hypothetical protein Pmar_PMAR001037 [Perkinsus marinus ATCC 50983]|uniref:Uncharacterized protein n=1 Tax=Perkinsus marinus (strain ATCC 50983 / TXsc) TaxID=423536 RepID=C5KTD6_PERM5|nr:hypothetical protein Pmar_PMAR001037 [Perkinsus marinus ATCC 50983]EER12240.1 hypothetical protein Pmar_PMAR001037 [Perkinsus marinus ATCC 50983]|eukprot:XP_002780445.1 hypothetical protein Pmar_PMAR001037 [Perkinsus marinus ATCC 50983]
MCYLVEYAINIDVNEHDLSHDRQMAAAKMSSVDNDDASIPTTLASYPQYKEQMSQSLHHQQWEASGSSPPSSSSRNILSRTQRYESDQSIILVYLSHQRLLSNCIIGCCSYQRGGSSLERLSSYSSKKLVISSASIPVGLRSGISCS